MPSSDDNSDKPAAKRRKRGEVEVESPPAPPALDAPADDTLPIIVSDHYKMRFTDLAISSDNRCAMLDLLRARADLLRGRRFVECDRAASDEELKLAGHTGPYLASLEARSVDLLARVSEMSKKEARAAGLDALFDGFVLPQRWCARGTLMAVDAALARGWAVNTAGGLHHASGPRGGQGLCFFADTTAAARHFWRRRPEGRLMIVDLDVHRGNGYEGDLLKEARARRVYILDAYNDELEYPEEYWAKRAIARNLPFACATTDAEYRAGVLAALAAAFAEFAPDLVLYVVGYDVLEKDPNGFFHATPATVVRREEAVASAARRAGVPLCVLVANCGYQRGTAATVAAALGRLIEVMQAAAPA